MRDSELYHELEIGDPDERERVLIADFQFVVKFAVEHRPGQAW